MRSPVASAMPAIAVLGLTLATGLFCLTLTVLAGVAVAALVAGTLRRIRVTGLWIR